MSYWKPVVALGVCAVILAHRFAAPQERALAAGKPQGSTVAGNPAPAPEQIRVLIGRAAQNQHANDRSLEEFERVEHIVTRRSENGEILSNRTLRIVPFGTGTLKLPMAENGVASSPEDFRHQLEYAVAILDHSMHPDDRARQELAKYQRRQRERAELVDASAKAFRMTWAGRETRNGRTLAKLLLEPDPNFKPPTRLAVVFQHVRATMWVDEAQAQIARVEGEIASDVYFGGGIAGKINQGGHFVMDQEEAAPGVWLPTLLNYNVDGRKFVFAFGVHERTEISRYRRIGPPSQAIEIIRSELNNPIAESPAR
ncbi:MAG TPA: hypothetical protein VGT24_11645 [Candidatus Acidoferrales bacterium]|nr:hypothetical protein [Candidatus Acidoferrales bacterium]